MRSSLFLMIGLTKADPKAHPNLIQSNLEKTFENPNRPAFKLKNELLTLRMSDPHLHIYITFVNDRKIMLRDYSILAKDVGFNWDKKPVTIDRLNEIFGKFKKDDWSEYLAHEKTIRIIYNEMEKLSEARIYCIPSSKDPFGGDFFEL